MSVEWSPMQDAVFNDAALGLGHTIVIARAGSGKTTTLCEAVRRTPEYATVLMLAFNERIVKELSQRAPRRAVVQTLHSFGFGAVCRAFGDVDKDERKVSNILRVLVDASWDSLPQRRALEKLVGLAKGCLAKTPTDILEVMATYELGEVPGMNVEAAAETAHSVLQICRNPSITAAAENPFDKGSEWRLVAGMSATIDYDDMIWLPAELGLPLYEYDRVFIDEAQDVNAAQLELAVRAVRTTHPRGRMFAVGDDRQAVYSFRGATHDAIDAIRKRLDAKTLPLTVSYRCPRAVIAKAREWVPDIEAAPDAPMGVYEEIAERDIYRLARPGDFVLSRTNAPLVGGCLRFIREGVAAIVVGRDVGTGLEGFVRSMHSQSAFELVERVHAWVDAEAAKLRLRGLSTDEVFDKAETIYALAEGRHTTSEIIATIERLFVNDDPERNAISLSSTHKAKGLERDRVFVLGHTYLRRHTVEEENLYYVALTRARRELRVCRPPRREDVLANGRRTDLDPVRTPRLDHDRDEA